MSTQTQTRIPISTLTNLPCPHGPGKTCIECVREGAFEFQGLAPVPALTSNTNGANDEL